MRRAFSASSGGRQNHLVFQLFSVLLGSEDEGLIGIAPFLVRAPETLLRLR